MTHQSIADREGASPASPSTGLSSLRDGAGSRLHPDGLQSTGAAHDPMALQALSISALCDDLVDLGAGKATGFRRLGALQNALGGGKSE